MVIHRSLFIDPRVTLVFNIIPIPFLLHPLKAVLLLLQPHHPLPLRWQRKDTTKLISILIGKVRKTPPRYTDNNTIQKIQSVPVIKYLSFSWCFAFYIIDWKNSSSCHVRSVLRTSSLKDFPFRN